jgi:hypothetical protein
MSCTVNRNSLSIILLNKDRNLHILLGSISIPTLIAENSDIYFANFTIQFTTIQKRLI